MPRRSRLQACFVACPASIYVAHSLCRRHTDLSCHIECLFHISVCGSVGRVSHAEPEWCQDAADDNGSGIWEFFTLVRRKLCSGSAGYDPEWGPVNTTVITCPCGSMPLFPDNTCVEAPYRTSCEDIECLNGLQPTYDGRCVEEVQAGVALRSFSCWHSWYSWHSWHSWQSWSRTLCILNCTHGLSSWVHLSLGGEIEAECAPTVGFYDCASG